MDQPTVDGILMRSLNAAIVAGEYGELPGLIRDWNEGGGWDERAPGVALDELGRMVEVLLRYATEERERQVLDALGAWRAQCHEQGAAEGSLFDD